MASTEAILDLSRRTYDAVHDPAGWSSALARIMDGVGGADTALILARDVERGPVEVVASVNVDWPVQARVAEVISAMALPPFMRGLTPGGAASHATLVDDHDLERSAYYNEVLRPRNVFHGVLVQPQRTSRLATYVGIYRSRRAGSFDAINTATLQALSPHLANALELRWRLREADLQMAGAYRALDHVSTGIVLTNAMLQPCFANTAAQAILDESDGLALSAGGRLAAATTRDTERLRQAIAIAQVDGANARLILTRPSSRPPLAVRVLPVAQLALAVPGRHRPTVALFVHASDRRQAVDTGLLTATYNLTPRESQLVTLLASGMALNQATYELGIRRDTFRTYLKRALDKTGTHRQAELVSLAVRGFAEL